MARTQYKARGAGPRGETVITYNARLAHRLARDGHRVTAVTRGDE
jgi:hypothetical protein